MASGLLVMGCMRHPRRKRSQAPAQAWTVLRYFVRHPEAADTLTGVARWRLLEDRVAQQVVDVHEALVWLVAQGLVVERLITGLDPVYRLNRGRAGEAERLVRASGAAKGVRGV